MSKLNHVVRAQQFDRSLIEEVLERAREMERRRNNGDASLLQELVGKILLTLFYEPSTRTRLSFETAMLRLGGNKLTTEQAGVFSSAAKGESLSDTIHVVSGFSDVIVLRHPDIGAAERAAKFSTVPIINGGDGAGQHPTQALLDLYTIWKHHGRLDGLTVAMVGDLANGRTVRSLTYMLSKFRNVRLVFIAHSAIKMRDDIKQHLGEHNVPFEETEDISVVSGVDVLYVTRIQKERFTDLAVYEKVKATYVIDLKVALMMKPDSIIMHPLPRVGELLEEVDNDPRAIYFEQARENGVFVRMALLQMVLKG